MAEQGYQRPAPAAGERTEGPGAVAAVVVVLLVSAAFVAGWRARGGLGRLMGYW